MIELSEVEVEEIVRKATKKKSVKIVEFVIAEFGNYLGFLGEYFRLKIDADVEGTNYKLNFFMKSLPFKDKKQRKMLEETGIFRKEVKLYEKLLLDLSQLNQNKKSWGPNAYLCRENLLVLDDLALKDYKILSSQKKFDQAHVEEIMKTLASFHCCSIVYEKVQKETGGRSIGEEFGELLFETSVCDIPWFHSGLKAIYDIALQKTRYGESHHDLLEKTFYEKIFGIINIMESSPFDVPKVLAHRDVWKNNLMFSYEDDKPCHCILVDFQTARYLPISVDVVMAVCCTVNKEHQADLFESYIKFYYEQLSEELNKFHIDLSTIMPYESFIKSCDYHKTFALVYNVIVIMITSLPREYFVDFGEDNFRDFADGNRSKFILDYMEKNAEYQMSLIEAVEAAIECIYKLPSNSC